MRTSNLLLYSIVIALPLISFALIFKKQEMSSVIKIDYVSPYILTITNVDCEKFYDYFEDINHVELKGEDAMAFIRMISNLEEIDSKYSSEVDTRARVELVTNEGIRHICIGLNSLEFENTHYQTTDSLIHYISNLNKE